MELSKLISKKAQGGLGITEIALTLLVLVVVALVGWGFYTNWTWFTSKSTLLPGDVEVLGQLCKATGTSAPQAFCAERGRIPLTL